MLRAYLVALTSVVLGIAVVACGGQIAPDDSGSTLDKSDVGNRDQGLKDQTPPPSKSAGSTPTSPPPVASDPSCTFDYGGASSSGAADGQHPYFTCESVDHYTCGGVEAQLDCSCASLDGKWQPGKCRCNGESFEFDCASGCVPGPEQYAQCKLPPPSSSSSSG